ncbi:MAG: GGDEF domain-containing protein, partial [Planctomycetota bacterium]
MLGYSRDEFLTLGWEQISASVQFDDERAAQADFDLEQEALEGQSVFVEWVFRAADGREIQTELRLTRLPSDRRQLIRASLVDITARKAAEQELQKTNDRLESLAGLDSLTDLPNRRRLLETLDRELQRVSRYGGNLSVVSLDADHLKPINDAYGHDMGDKALIALARVLEA